MQVCGLMKLMKKILLCSLGQPVVFAQYNDLHLAGCILKIFLRDLTEPLLTFRLYPELISLANGE